MTIYNYNLLEETNSKCNVCKQYEKLKKCENCMKKKICKKCLKTEKLCISCNEDYNNFCLKIQKLNNN